MDGEEGVHGGDQGKEGREVVGSHSPLEEELHRERDHFGEENGTHLYTHMHIYEHKMTAQLVSIHIKTIHTYTIQTHTHVYTQGFIVKKAQRGGGAKVQFKHFLLGQLKKGNSGG